MKRPAIALAMRPDRTQHVLPPELLARLEQLGLLLDPTPMTTFTDDRARRLLAETEILVTGWGAPLFDADALAATPNLRLVAHAAGTVKGIVGPWVFDAGVLVTHAAQANALPVAEFTLAAIIFSGKNVFRFRDLYVAHRDRTLTHPLQAEPIGNYRRVVGIVGASRIGRRVIELLRPFDYEILLYDPMVTESEAADLRVEKVDLDSLFARADIVSLHAPSLPQTHHMVDARRLSLMKNGATLINTARGALIDEEALLDTLKTGAIDAVIDVTDPEIPERASAFYDLPNVFLTPHIAGAVGLERARLGETVIDEIARFIDGRPLRYEVRGQDLERMA
ncbi:hydroxyacid dehydrogenase [Pararhizobium sp. BT-229]|uniref:hydroxyacid dehydrogenase n=1 Tax=Pararhizobium sp. BT-229 TaxID=2986923 RepID=UPI0021F71303|nr:hydroxyacid dehydrogenase [Pararhizobium sp. BT-229]MCV9961671.1 hydroxyacid dehydrogenase [Pararhizobium sp. BT-229]